MSHRALLLFVPYLTILLLTVPGLSSAITIMNSATVTPPCTDSIWITWSEPFALYIPLGLDDGSAVARCPRPLSGTAKPYARSYVSSLFLSGGNRAFARANSGMGFDGFTPGRPSQFIVDFDVLFSGQAALYVPYASTWAGGADALLNVAVYVQISEMVVGLPAVTWEWQYPIVDHVRTYHGTPTWVWNELRTFSSGPLWLEPGRQYAARIELFCYTEANTIGASGGGTAWVNFENPALGAGFVVNSVTFRDATPDGEGPTTSLAAGSLTAGVHCLPLGTLGKVILQATDGDGYGVESIRYRVDGGAEQIYDPWPDIQLGPGDHSVEFWAMDRVGNEGDHEWIGLGILWPAAAPGLIGVADGSVGIWQPISLEWEAVAEAAGYRMQIDDDPGFESPLVDLSQAGTLASVQGLPLSSLLYWRVQSLNDCNGGPWSATWSFTTDVSTAVGSENPGRIPTRTLLGQNHPNPFNPKTTISVGLPHEDLVALRVYSRSGQLIRTLVDGPLGAGFHEIPWSGRDEAGRAVASGVYLYRLVTTDFDETRKLTLVR